MPAADLPARHTRPPGAALEGMGRCSDRRGHGGGCAVKTEGFGTLMLWLAVGVSWEEPQLLGPQVLSAAATSPLPARAGASR